MIRASIEALKQPNQLLRILPFNPGVIECSNLTYRLMRNVSSPGAIAIQ